MHPTITLPLFALLALASPALSNPVQPPIPQLAGSGIQRLNHTHPEPQLVTPPQPSPLEEQLAAQPDEQEAEPSSFSSSSSPTTSPPEASTSPTPTPTPAPSPSPSTQPDSTESSTSTTTWDGTFRGAGKPPSNRPHGTNFGPANVPLYESVPVSPNAWPVAQVDEGREGVDGSLGDVAASSSAASDVLPTGGSTAGTGGSVPSAPGATTAVGDAADTSGSTAQDAAGPMNIVRGWQSRPRKRTACKRAPSTSNEDDSALAAGRLEAVHSPTVPLTHGHTHTPSLSLPHAHTHTPYIPASEATNTRHQSHSSTHTRSHHMRPTGSSGAASRRAEDHLFGPHSTTTTSSSTSPTTTTTSFTSTHTHHSHSHSSAQDTETHSHHAPGGAEAHETGSHTSHTSHSSHTWSRTHTWTRSESGRRGKMTPTAREGKDAVATQSV